MDQEAIDVQGRISFSNANCALPKTVKSADGGGRILALSGTYPQRSRCPLLGVRRTEPNRRTMSPFDPNPTCFPRQIPVKCGCSYVAAGQCGRMSWLELRMHHTSSGGWQFALSL